MSTLGHLEAAFLSIFGRVPAEPGEFDAPDAAAVKAARDGVAAHKARLREATPVPALGTSREGAEL